MRLTLHIGTHKSGSSAIQKAATIESHQLEAAGIFYPLGVFPEFPDQHSELFKLLTDKSKNELEKFFRKLVIESRLRNIKEVFMSGEDMSSLQDPAALEDFYSIVKQYFDDIRVVLVVRNVGDFLLSHARHTWRYNRSQLTLEETAKFIQIYPKTIFDAWAGAFGEGKVVVVPYDTVGVRSFLFRFYQDIFCYELHDNTIQECKGTNKSMDTLCLLLINTVLKALPNYDINKINSNYIKCFRSTSNYIPNLDNDLKLYLQHYADLDSWTIGDNNFNYSIDGDIGADFDPECFLLSLHNFIYAIIQEALPPSPDKLSDQALKPLDDHKLTNEKVYLLYQILLDRPPENDEVVENALSHGDVPSLRRAILRSPEYSRRNGE